MKISQIAAATLIPATVAGVVLTAVPFAHAAPVATAAHHVAAHPAQATTAAVKPAAPHRVPRAVVHHARPVAHRAAGSTAGSAAQHPSQASQASTPMQPAAAPGQPLTTGMSAFEQCVAWHESGDNPTASSAGLFGILPATWGQLGYSGTAGQASVALQKVAFQRLYAEYGTSPWAPYDGC
jgi:hypothetical protein